MMGITNPVLKYYGSKFRLAKWIIEHFPAHRHYVEPFGGGGSVLLVKEPSTLETYNDLDGDIVNFFRMLREQPNELLQQIKLTPWSRDEFGYCIDEVETANPIEKARRLFFRIWMNHHGGVQPSVGNWRRHKNGKRPVFTDIKIQNLIIASERLKNAQLENRDAFKLIAEMDSPDTLFYLDPPYIFSTRAATKQYSFEMTDDKHREFAELLYSVKGFVVLSGYPSKIYEELFEKKGWRRIDKRAFTMRGTERTECIWISPRTVEALFSS